MNLEKAGANAYHSTPTGRLVIFIEDDAGITGELKIEANDVPRLMYACIDALQKKVNTR